MAEPGRSLRVLVVDDEPMARASITNLLANDPEIEVVGECGDGNQAVDSILRERPDLVFLDIQMPGRTGLEVLDALPEDRRPRVIFTTAFDQYAVHAFEVHAIDYLLKPFDDARFARALVRAKEDARRDDPDGVERRLADLLSLFSARGMEGLREAEPPAATVESLDRITIHREGRVDVVDVGDVDWIEAADQYVRLHTTDGELLMRESMNQLEQSLDPARFLRVHRSAIVALDRVRRLESQSGGVGRLLLADGTWVPVARARMSTVRKALG